MATDQFVVPVAGRQALVGLQYGQGGGRGRAPARLRTHSGPSAMDVGELEYEWAATKRPPWRVRRDRRRRDRMARESRRRNRC